MSANLPSSDVIDALLKDPLKRALILQLLNDQKDNIENYKKQQLKTQTTPLKKSRRIHCESPTALQRRRALEQRNVDSGSESVSSDLSEPTEVSGPKLPFNELLKGVRAYVEIRRDGVDKSEGIKAVMRLMGATVRDKFTNDVTHVIFKDGSFTTYEKAKLLKVHLVSVLWLDAVRRNSVRVPEKNYPAFGSRVCDANVSILCSQIQRDYEDVVKDERRRRHTLMTPKASLSSYMTATNIDEPSKSPEISSDDSSDCGVINGQSSKRSKSDLLKDSPNLTDDLTDSTSKMSSCGDSSSLLSRVGTRNRRKTVNVISDMVLTPNVVPVRETEIVEATPVNETRAEKKVLQNSSVQSSTMSSLAMSTDSDKTKSGLGSEQFKTKGKENVTGTTNTTMSSLRLSESPKNSKRRSRSSSKLNEESQLDKEVEDIIRKSRRKTTSVGSSAKNKKEETNKKSRRKTMSTSSTSNKDKETEGIDGTTRCTRSSIRSKNENLEGSTSVTSFNSDWNDSKSTENRSSTNAKVIESLIDSLSSEKSEDKSPQKTRRSSRRRILESSEFEDKDSRHVRRSSVSTRQSQTKDESSQASSIEKTNRKSISVRLTQIEISKEKTYSTPKKNRKSQEPSPAKKTRVEEPPSNKKTRKLYNPDVATSAILPIEEDKEREEYLKQKKTSPDGVFLVPNALTVVPVTTRKKTQSEDSSDEVEVNNKKPKATKSKKKKDQIPPRRNSTADEQRELLILLDKSDNTKTQRLALSQTKSSSTNVSVSSLPITPIKRRSTLDFVAISQTQQKRRLKLDPKRSSSIVCTKMHRQEVVDFEGIVSRLGRFFVEDQVTGNTTHLVVGEPKRTINMLRAIARGCWILKHDWLLKSAEEGRWLSEEDYELTNFSPAVQQCRLQREAFGPLYSMDIFEGCGYIYVGKNTTPRTSDLKELIFICKGKVTNVYRNASICVGEFFDREEIVCVTEMWVLDCIHFNKLKSFTNYLIKTSGGGVSPQV